MQGGKDVLHKCYNMATSFFLLPHLFTHMTVGELTYTHLPLMGR